MKSKRILSILLTLCMLLSMIAQISVFADITPSVDTLKQTVEVVNSTAETPKLSDLSLYNANFTDPTVFAADTIVYAITASNASVSFTPNYDKDTQTITYSCKDGDVQTFDKTEYYFDVTMEYGESTLIVTLTDDESGASTDYTFTVTFPIPSSTDNSIDTAYTPFKATYGSSWPYSEAVIYQANESGEKQEPTTITNEHKYYYAELPAGTNSFYFTAYATDYTYAKIRYRVNDGEWQDNANALVPDAKLDFQIISGNQYYTSPIGWDNKTTNDFTVWVKCEETPTPTLNLSGNGTEDDPYLLTNADDFINLDKLVENGETFTGKYFKVTENITLPEGWNGIGYGLVENVESWGGIIPTMKEFKPFSGILDGNEKTLTFNNVKPLFDAVRNAEIKDFNIIGTYITGNGLVDTYTTDNGIDGVANNADDWTAKISGVDILESTKIAGSGFISGYARGTNTIDINDCHIEKGVIIGCNSEGESLNISNIGSFGGDFCGTVTDCTSAATVYGKDFVGGIVGGQGQSMTDTVISNCTFSGFVEATGNYVGGISGCGYTGTGWGFSNNAGCIDIKDCIVTGSIAGGDYVGGILGAEPAVMQCWENGIGTISGNRFVGNLDSSGSYVGGIIGYIKSLNKYNQISDNTYQNADKGTGGITYVDTNYVNPTVVEGTTYVNSETEKTGVAGMSKTGHNRTDDPLGADEDKFVRKIGTERIYVTIANAGEIVMTQESILVSDHNKNGILDIDDALYFAHEYGYEGGAKEGYTSYTHKDYGLSISKLWGNTSGNFGYYVNNNSAWSLADEVKKGDYVTAFVYKNADWSDRYSYFDVNTATVVKGNTLELTLTNVYYSPDGQVTEGASDETITINGSKTEITTDENGKVTLTFDKVGTYIVSAIGAEGTTLVPPICVVTVTKAETGGNGGSTPDTDMKVRFKLLGDDNHGEKGGTHTLKSNNLKTWIAETTYTIDSGDTVWDVLKMALDKNDMTCEYNTKYDTIYIESVTNNKGETLTEFTNGPRSGWMYTLNGEHTDLGVSQQKLKNNDVIVFHYTDDYNVEKYSSNWSSSSSGNNTTQKDETKTEESNAVKTETTVSGTTATVTTSEKNITNAITEAKKDNASEIVITSGDTKKADTIKLEIPANSVKEIAESKDLTLTVATNAGDVAISNETLNAIVEQSRNTESLNIVVETKTADETMKNTENITETVLQDVLKNATIVEVTITTGNTSIRTFGGHKLSVDVPVDGKNHEQGKIYKVHIISADGSIETTYGECVEKNGKLSVRVATKHLSSFIVTDIETAPFTDIPDHWAYEAIKYAYNNSIMQGVGESIFAPDDTMTRAMLVTVLYRLEDEPAVNKSIPFADVKSGEWYENAVTWAQQNGIVSGVSETEFAPNKDITREQMATILYRYAQYKKQDTSVGENTNILSYDDTFDISEYAFSAIQWMVGSGLLKGETESTINPQGNCTRAQVATILMRYLEM